MFLKAQASNHSLGSIDVVLDVFVLCKIIYFERLIGPILRGAEIANFARD